MLFRQLTVNLVSSIQTRKIALHHENVKNFCLNGNTRWNVINLSQHSRNTEKKYQYAGKTGTSQIKRITEEQRELDLDIHDIPYEDRDHALFVAFAPYKNPRYAISVLIEHGGSGGKVAAPLAKKVIKVVIDRHNLREKFRKERRTDI